MLAENTELPILQQLRPPSCHGPLIYFQLGRNDINIYPRESIDDSWSELSTALIIIFLRIKHIFVTFLKTESIADKLEPVSSIISLLWIVINL